MLTTSYLASHGGTICSCPHFFLCVRFSTLNALFSSLSYSPFFFFFFLDESVEAVAKKEEEVEVLRSWVEAGGFPTRPEEEAKSVMMEVSPPSCAYHQST